jgi:hypothetical protein
MTDETKIDSDHDGLSDAVERRLGTNVNKADSDGDGLIDGFEVAVDHVRVRDLGIKDPAGSAAIVDDLVKGVEDQIGVTEHNVDSDGDGFADWVEEMRGGSDRSVADLTPEGINQSGANPNPLDAFISRARSQIGAQNRFGAEVDLDDSTGSSEFDSSELVQWAAHQAGVEMPDGSWKQYRALTLAGHDTSVEAALGTKGALVFGFSSDPMASADRPDRAYVAISLGNGKVLEISERTGELMEVDAAGRNYTHAATIPEFTSDIFDDTDGDRHPDIDEELMGGDPTTGITTPWRDSRNIDTDGDGTSDAEDVDPNDPTVSTSASDASAATDVATGVDGDGDGSTGFTLEDANVSSYDTDSADTAAYDSSYETSSFEDSSMTDPTDEAPEYQTAQFDDTSSFGDSTYGDTSGYADYSADSSSSYADSGSATGFEGDSAADDGWADS